MVEIVQDGGESEIEKIKTLIQGDEINISELSQLSNENIIKKMYKITDLELTIATLSEAVVSRIATKHFINYGQ